MTGEGVTLGVGRRDRRGRSGVVGDERTKELVHRRGRCWREEAGNAEAEANIDASSGGEEADVLGR